MICGGFAIGTNPFQQSQTLVSPRTALRAWEILHVRKQRLRRKDSPLKECVVRKDCSWWFQHMKPKLLKTFKNSFPRKKRCQTGCIKIYAANRLIYGRILSLKNSRPFNHLHLCTIFNGPIVDKGLQKNTDSLEEAKTTKTKKRRERQPGIFQMMMTRKMGCFYGWVIIAI